MNGPGDSNSSPPGPSGPDPVEQLQRAVLTFIGAARVALDALEGIVADRTRLDDLAAGGRDFVGSFLGAVFGRESTSQSGSGSARESGADPSSEPGREDPRNP
jgi:hypothetical protein